MKSAKWSWCMCLLFVAPGATGPAAASPLAPPTPSTLRALYGLRAPRALNAVRTALLLVDFQEEFVHGHLPLPGVGRAVAHAVELSAWARRAGILVVDVRNVITRPGSPLFGLNEQGSAFVSQLEPQSSDLVIVKATGGAFSKTSLDSELRARGIDTLLVAGLMTHLAVQITVSDGALLGYHVVVAADATATRTLPGAYGDTAVDSHLLQRAALATMADRAADVMLSQTILRLPLEVL